MKRLLRLINFIIYLTYRHIFPLENVQVIHLINVSIDHLMQISYNDALKTFYNSGLDIKKSNSLKLYNKYYT